MKAGRIWLICEARQLGNYAGNGLIGDVSMIDWLSVYGRAGVGNFRVSFASRPRLYVRQVVGACSMELSHQTRHAPDDVPGQGECAVNKLKQLEACGQSAWLDDLKRSLIERVSCARSSGATD